MSEPILDHGVVINSLIGAGTVFKGDLVLTGLLRIDGDFSGAIKTPGKVLIGKTGRVSSQITAGSVVIGGAVKGNIIAAGKVHILSSGIFIGSITSPRLELEEGVIFHGVCRVNHREEPETLKPGKGPN
ncbi:MAG: polymer-forming cytoskeletal protein [Spirochaetales bacterium]|jgi:cytoskeletal protein CcmA (bactofilin family)|nr:polymer-forming cytoskeletal protein [Spirochaetales bacterium]